MLDIDYNSGPGIQMAITLVCVSLGLVGIYIWLAWVVIKRLTLGKPVGGVPAS